MVRFSRSFPTAAESQELSTHFEEIDAPSRVVGVEVLLTRSCEFEA
jgi:hypothetical protein